MNKQYSTECDHKNNHEKCDDLDDVHVRIQSPELMDDISENIVPFKQGVDHDEKKNLLCVQDIDALLDLGRRILQPHQKTSESQPAHYEKREHQPVIGP